MPDNVSCRLLNVDDVEMLRDIRLRALKEHPEAFFDDHEEVKKWPIERFKGWFGNGWIAAGFLDDKPIALSGLYREKGAKVQHRGAVWGVYVAPEARGRNIARRLIEMLLAEARKAGLEKVTLSTDITNEHSKRLYQSLGFEPWGIEKHILKLPEGYVDDVVMSKFL